MSYSNTVGERLSLSLSDDGIRSPNYGYGATLKIRDGWNDRCEWATLNLSVDDLHDLRYLINRALECSEPRKT